MSHEVLLHRLGWRPCTVIGDLSPDEGEDFRRVNVRLESGGELLGCHPDCVREASACTCSIALIPGEECPNGCGVVE